MMGIILLKPSDPPTCGCGREFIDTRALNNHIKDIRDNHYPALDEEAHRLRDITPSRTAKAKSVIAQAIAERDGSIWRSSRTEMEKAIRNPALPRKLTIEEFRELWDAEIDAELEKFR